MENDFTSIEKEIIKSLKKEVLSKDDIDFRFAYYKMLFDPVLDLAEKAIKQYIKVIKAADNENFKTTEELVEDSVKVIVIDGNKYMLIGDKVIEVK